MTIIWDLLRQVCVSVTKNHLPSHQVFSACHVFPNTACQKSIPSIPCMHTCGLWWRRNNVAVHDPCAGTFHCVTLRRPPTPQKTPPSPPLPVWILWNVPVVPQSKPLRAANFDFSSIKKKHVPASQLLL